MSENTDTTNPYEVMMPAYERWALPVSTQIAEVIIQDVGDLTGKHLLDVGAGVGSLALPAARAGASVLAIDNTAAMVDRLREQLASFPKSHAELMDMRKLTAKGPKYDVVASILSAAFMPDAQEVFARMVLSTRERGAVYVASWGQTYGSPIYKILATALAALPITNGLPTSPGLTRYLVAQELEQALTDAGCCATRSWTLELSCELPPPSAYQRELMTFLRVVPAYAALSAPERERLQPLIEEEYKNISSVAGKYFALARANLAVGHLA